MKPVVFIGGVGLAILFLVFEVTCTGKAPHTNLAPPPSDTSPIPGLSSPDTRLPLRILLDVPLSGGATRFDYQSIDPDTNRLLPWPPERGNRSFNLLLCDQRTYSNGDMSNSS